MLLPPYLIAQVDPARVVESIHMPDGQATPLILAVSPCRSGSTVMLRVFGASGIPAHFQPLKNTLRWAMQGEPWRWDVPEGNTPVFIKETLGPYTLLEATFDPFELLRAVKYPLEKLRVVIIGRDPLYAWASWYQNWGAKTNVEIMIAAFRQVEAIRQEVQEAGLSAVHFVYEAVRDFGPEAAIRGLFGQLGLPYSELAIKGWGDLPAYGTPGSNIICDLEPPPFVVPHIHDRVEQAEELVFYAGSDPLKVCMPEDLEKIRASGVSNLFDAWRDACYSYLKKES